MNGEEYERDIRASGLNQQSAARLFGADARTGRRWVEGGPPRTVAILVKMLVAGAVTVADIERYKAEVENV